MGSDRPVGRWLGMLHRYARKRFTEQMAVHGLADAQFPILMSLLQEDGVSQEDLAQHHLLDKATVARSVARLEELGYVTRQADEHDRRVKRVLATELAREIEPELQHMREEWSETLTEGFTEGERKTLDRLLERMAENAGRFLDREMQQ